MPNLPGLGLSGRPDIGIGAPTLPVSIHGTPPGVTVPMAATEVWCSGPNNVPQLVWSSTADPVTSVVATYSTPAGASQVALSWTVHAAPAKNDGFNIYRPDGSLAGTAYGQYANSFVDLEPRALTGSYTVVGLLVGVPAAAVASNSLALANPPRSMTATWDAANQRVLVSWVAPTYGIPDVYAVYINGAYIGPLGGSATSWANNYPQPAGVTNTYVIVPVISGTAGTSATDTEPIPSAVPTGITYSGTTISWGVPAYGLPNSYDVFRDGAYLGPLTGSVTSWNSGQYPGEGHNYVIRAQYPGGAYGDAGVAVYTPTPDPRGAYGSPINLYRTGGGTNQLVMENIANYLTGQPATSTTAHFQRYSTALGVWEDIAFVTPNMSAQYTTSALWNAYSAAGEYGRVRWESGGTPSIWVQLGPV